MYFDNAATSYPKPDCVVAAATEAFLHAGNPGRGAHEYALWSMRILHSTREKAGQLFGADPSRVAFTMNATMALNMAINMVDGEILTTAMEHNSVLRPLHARGNFRIVDAPGGELNVDRLIDEIGPDTAAVVMTHCSNLTGEIYDAARVGRACRERGIIFILDAAQTAGVIPVDMEELCADMLAFPGHKGLLAPQGTGGLILSDRIHPRPLIHGGTGSRSHDLLHPDDMPDALEAGTHNIHGLAGLEAALDYISEIGVENIYAHEKTLSRGFIGGVLRIPGIEVYRPFCERAGTVSLSLDGTDSALLCEELADRGLSVRGGMHCAPLAHMAIGTGEKGAVRFSFGISNTESEVEDAVEILREIAAGR